MRRILDLKEYRVGLSLILLSNLDHKYGPKYLKECFPYCTLLNLGRQKSYMHSKEEFETIRQPVPIKRLVIISLIICCSLMKT